MNNIDILKEELKELAKEISNVKSQRKTVHFKGTRTMPAWKANMVHQRLKYEFRHKHIAYCLLRGKDINEIEPKVRLNNEPNWTCINDLKRRYAPIEIEEAV